MKEFWQNFNKVSAANLALLTSVLFSIIFMFFIQFSVEALQNEIAKSESEIASYQDQIQMLEVEWTYVTRPQRLRILSSYYLKDNGYMMASQVKDVKEIEDYHLANQQKLDMQASKESATELDL